MSGGGPTGGAPFLGAGFHPPQSQPPPQPQVNPSDLSGSIPQLLRQQAQQQQMQMIPQPIKTGIGMAQASPVSEMFPDQEGEAAEPAKALEDLHDQSGGEQPPTDPTLPPSP